MNTETKAKATETPQPQAPLTVSPSTVVPSGAGKYFDALAYEAIAAGQPVASVTPAALGVMTVPNPSSFPVVRLASAPTYWQVVGIAANAAQPGQPVKVITSDPSLG